MKPLFYVALICLSVVLPVYAGTQRIDNNSSNSVLNQSEDVGPFTSITAINGQIAVSYYDGSNRDLKLWLDDGRGGGVARDGVANGEEIRIRDLHLS